MKTIFYKILNSKNEVIYVGVTTRSLQERFNEHVSDKSLNKENYTIFEFDSINHNIIESIEDFYNERKK